MILKSGGLAESHSLAPIEVLARRRSLKFAYLSETANPQPVIGTTFNAATSMTSLRVEAHVGTYSSETFYAPTTSGPVYHAFQWKALDSSGNKVPTGVYPVIVTAHIAQPAAVAETSAPVNRDIESDVKIERFLAVQNKRDSPFGAGWWLSELDQLVPGPRGTIMWAGGTGSSAVYYPGFASEVIAGSLTPGFSGDGGPAAQAALNGASDIVSDASGNLYVLDSGNVRVRKIDLQGIITTVAGNGTTGSGGDGGPATAASLNHPTALAVGPDGSLYIAEAVPFTMVTPGPGPVPGPGPIVPAGGTGVRKVDPSGVITTAIQPSFQTPTIDRMVFDASTSSFIGINGQLSLAFRISSGTAMVIVAGGAGGSGGFSGDEIPAKDAQLNGPTGVTLDAQGQIYLADSGNHRIRLIDTSGVIHTIVGTGRIPTTLQEAIPATSADIRLGPGAGLSVTPAGELIFAEPLVRVVRRVSPDGTLTTIAGVSTSDLDSLRAGAALGLSIGSPRSLTLTPQGSIAFTEDIQQLDSATSDPNHYVRILEPTLSGTSFYVRQPGVFNDLVRHSDGTFTLQEPDGIHHEFSKGGVKLKRIDRSKNVTQYFYTNGLLTTIKEPSGGTWSLGYSGSKLDRVTDSAGRITSFRIDGNGDLSSITDPDTSTVTYGYNSDHQMTSRTTAVGYQVAMTYNSRGQVTQLNEPDGGKRRLAAQDGLGLIEDLAGTGSACQPAPLVRADAIRAILIDARNQPWIYKLDNFRQMLSKTDPLARTTLMDRDRNGLVTTETRPNNSKVLSSYGLRGELLQREDLGISDPQRPGHGATTTYTYSVDFALTTSVVDPLRHVTRIQRDSAGNPVLMIGPDGIQQPMGFDSRGLPTLMTDRNGNQTSQTFDTSGNLTQITRPDQCTVLITRTPEGYVKSRTDENGHTTVYQYTPFGLESLQINAQGNSRETRYDADRRPVVTIDEEGRITRMEYTSRDQLAKRTSPTGRVGTWAYDLENDLVSTVDAKLRETTQEFDAARQLIKTTRPGNVVTQYLYGAIAGCGTCSSAGGLLGVPTEIIDPNGHETHTSTDASGRTTQTMDAIGGVTTVVLDVAGNVVQTIAPDGLGTQTIYDALNRPRFVIDPRTGATGFTRDGEGHAVKEVNANGQITEREYDNRNRLIRLTMAAGTTDASTVRFGYDCVGNMTSLTTPRGFKWRFGFDELNRLVKETDPLSHSASMEYSPVGNLQKRIDRKGQTTTYGYNNENERTLITYQDGSTVAMDYDATGMNTFAADTNSRINYTYDDLDRMASAAIPVLGRATTMRYDPVGNRLGFAINGLETTYTYDPLNRLKSLLHASGAKAAWKYDPIGLVTHKDLPNGVTLDMSYDHRKLMTMAYKNAAGQSLQNLAFQYDSLANITSMTDDFFTRVYTYDNQNRITSNTMTAPKISNLLLGGPAVDNYTYDEDSNRTTRVTCHFLSPLRTFELFTYDGADQILTRSFRPLTDPANPAATTLQNVYTHDANGNMSSMMSVASTTTTSMTTSFSHDARDRMVQVTLPSGRTIQNEYLPDSPLRLFFTKPDGTKVNVLWDLATQNLAQDLDVSNATVAEYIQGNQMDETLGMIRGGGTFAYVTDQVQSVRNLIDANGAAANTYYTNSPFGEQYFVQESVENRLRFTSREWEQSAGLQYNRHRYNLPALGRWTQRDPIGFGDGFNLYAYARQSPMNHVDPTGKYVLFWDDAVFWGTRMYYPYSPESQKRLDQAVKDRCYEIDVRVNYFNLVWVEGAVARGETSPTSSLNNALPHEACCKYGGPPVQVNITIYAAAQRVRHGFVSPQAPVDFYYANTLCHELVHALGDPTESRTFQAEKTFIYDLLHAGVAPWSWLNQMEH